MSCEDSFYVTETMDEVLQQKQGVDYAVIEMLVERVTNGKTVNQIPLSMTGQEDEVIQTGVLILDGDEYGFQLSRTQESDGIRVLVEVAPLDWSL